MANNLILRINDSDITSSRIILNKEVILEIMNFVYNEIIFLNNSIKETYNIDLFKNIDSKDEFLNKVLSGSSLLLLNEPEITRYKNVLGDIDVQVNKDLKEEIINSLQKNKNFIGGIYCIKQYITLFRIPSLNKIIQIDFELVDVDESGFATDWNRFARSSNILDIKNNIKGVFHKYLISSIDYAFTDEPKKHEYAFSVDYGLRKRFDDLGNELKKTEYVYTNDIKIIFENLFRNKTFDINKVYSFVGLIEIIKEHMNNKQKCKIIEEMIYKLWGKGSQKIDKYNILNDISIKMNALTYMYENIDVKNKHINKLKKLEEKLKTKYYENN